MSFETKNKLILASSNDTRSQCRTNPPCIVVVDYGELAFSNYPDLETKINKPNTTRQGEFEVRS